MFNNIFGTLIFLLSLLIFVNIIVDKNFFESIFRKIFFIIPPLIVSAFVFYDSFLPYITIIFLIYSALFLSRVFNISTRKSLIILFLFFINFSIIDIIFSIILLYFVEFDNIKEKYNILVNVIVFGFSVFPLLNKKLLSFYNTIVIKSEEINLKLTLYVFILFFSIILIIILMSFNFNIYHLVILLFLYLSFLFLTIILISEGLEKYRIINKYNEIDEYVNSFESIINKQNINIHEYKNQLSIIKDLSNSKKVKEYINTILSDFSFDKSKNFVELNNLPKNGLRSLLYYKMTVAEKCNISFSLDISKNIKGEINKINTIKLKYLLNYLGVFIDNAIESSLNTKKKNILLEIYKVNKEIKIVISNYIEGKIEINKINDHGYSTKGSNRGKGLFLVNKLNKENEYFNIITEIKDDLFIVCLTIKD